MEQNKSFRKLMGAIPFLSDKEKLECMTKLIGSMENNRPLMKKAVGIAERAYHPMAEIEKWMETRYTKKPCLTPTVVIEQCVSAMKLKRGIVPLLWPLSRRVKARVRSRIIRKQKPC